MYSEKKKIKMEPVNDLEKRIDALERIQGLVAFDKLEIEKKMIEHQKQNQKVKDVRVKTEERTICGNNQTLIIADLHNKVSELQNQALEKDRVMGAYLDRLQCFGTKVTEMEKEIEELKQQKWADNQIMEALRSKLLESEMREGRLKENNTEASKTVEELRCRIFACEEEKKMLGRIQDEVRRKEMENTRCVDELRRKNMEAGNANEIMARELSKANSAVKELKERNLAAHKAAEVHMKRFENLVPIAEDLTNLLKMNVDGLQRLRNKFVGNDTMHGEAGPQASKALNFRISACKQSTKTRKSHEATPLSVPTLGIIEIIDCDGETEMIHDKYVSIPSPNKRSKQNGIDCSEISPISPKRKRSNLGVGHNNSPVNKKWRFGADMIGAFEEDDELCMHAVCALYKQQVSASESTEGSDRVLYHFEALRGRDLAEYLIDGDPELRITKSVSEVKQRLPDVVNQCRRLAIDYSSYFIAMPRNPSLDQVKPLPLSLFQ